MNSPTLSEAPEALVPRVPTEAMLRPFYECPPEELQLAWNAMLYAAEREAAPSRENADTARHGSDVHDESVAAPETRSALIQFAADVIRLRTNGEPLKVRESEALDSRLCDLGMAMRAEADRITAAIRESVAATVAAQPVPAPVMEALDRMCTPLDKSRLSGATAEADARCMAVIREYILGTLAAGKPTAPPEATWDACNPVCAEGYKSERFCAGTCRPKLAAQSAPPAEPVAQDEREPAPPNSLPAWDECALRVGNSEFIAKRVAEGGYGPEPDSLLATELHRFIHEYDDADPYRSAWFLHRLEMLLDETRRAAMGASPPAAKCQCLFDAWRENPYTKVLEKSIAEDYVPKADASPPAVSDSPLLVFATECAFGAYRPEYETVRAARAALGASMAGTTPAGKENGK